MLKRAMLTAILGLSLTFTSFAQPARTMITGTSDTKSVYENVETGPQRTTLTRENKYPDTGSFEVGGFFEYTEINQDLQQERYGVIGRFGVAEFVTLGVEVPFVNAEFLGEDNSGLGDVVVSLDLLAYQDIFQYPFVIPHADVSLDTGDEDEGLGAGDTSLTLGVSVGTVVGDALTWIADISYIFDSGRDTAESNDVFTFAASLIWDISDRLALVGEGRVYEQNRFDNFPYEYKLGLAYKISRDAQIAVYGGSASDDTDVSDDQYDLAEARVSVLF